MRRLILLGFLLLLTFDTGGQVGMKLAADRIGELDLSNWLAGVVREPLIHLVLLCYLGAFLTYVSLLKYAPVGPAYAAAHGHIVSVLVISMLFLGERLSAIQGVGVMAIVIGIIILAVTETRPESASTMRISHCDEVPPLPSDSGCGLIASTPRSEASRRHGPDPN